MGSLLSKKKVGADPSGAKPGSAPARLEGLDGVSPGHDGDRRAITPPNGGTSSEPGSPRKGKPKKIDLIGKQTDGSQLAAALPAAAAVSVPEDAAAWAQAFGDINARNLFSSDWKDREQGLLSISKALSSGEGAKKDVEKAYAASAQIIDKFVKDKVAPLYHASLDLLRETLAAFSTKLPQATLHAGMNPLVPKLLSRCGNLNTRIHEASLQAVLGIAGHKNFGTAYIGPFALSPLPARAKAAAQSAQMFGRLDLIYSLLTTYCLSGADAPGMGMKDTLSFVKTGLEMPDEKVRSAAVKLVVEMYRMEHASGRDLDPERYVGPLKPALLQILHRQFDEARTEMAGGGGGGGGEPALGSGITIKAPKGGLPPLGGATGSLRSSGLPPLGSKLRGSTSALRSSMNMEVSGTAVGTVVASGEAPLGKPPPSRGGRPPPSRGGRPPASRGNASDGERSIDGVITESNPIRNPSPGNLRPNMSREGSFNAQGRRSLRSSGPGSQIPPSMLDQTEESLIMFIAGEGGEAPGTVN